MESKLVYITGDIFAAPENTILVHACNTVGSWGGGIALAFRNKYPAQFQLYKARCQEHGQALVGTCFLIPDNHHSIACLFTSRAYGKRKDKPDEILAATRTAVEDLIRQNTTHKQLHAWYVLSSLHKPELDSHLPLHQPFQFW
jgi:ADP-ribose 1''-phosphate phosphatase